MKIFFGFLILISTTLSFAGVGGNWQGWGEWSYDGSGSPCDMKISFNETSKSFSRTSGYFDCSIIGLDLEPVTYTKNGENLFDGDKLIGRITENSLELKEAYSETVTIDTKLIVEGHHADYLEIWTGQDGNQIYKITGRLFLKDSF